VTARVILLMKDPEAAFFRDILGAANPRLTISHAPDLDRLQGLSARPDPGCRLIAFSTQIIVPATVLQRLAFNAYNFHPGPPNYPGSRPSAFAVYNGAQEFGVTLHQMAARVDSGPIIAARRFSIPKVAVATDVAMEAYGTLLRLAMAFAPALVAIDQPLPTSEERWSGKKYRLQDYETLRQITPGMDGVEIERRYRACDGIYSPLSGV